MTVEALTAFQVAQIDLEQVTGGCGSVLWRALRLPLRTDLGRLRTAVQAVGTAFPTLADRINWQEEQASAPLSERRDRIAASPLRWGGARAAAHLLHNDGPPLLMLGIHHAAVDFAALPHLLGAIGAAYAGKALAAGPPTPASFRPEIHDLLGWRHALAGLPPMLDLARCEPRNGEGWHHPAATLTQRLGTLPARLARRLRTTPFRVTLAGLAAVLARRTGAGETMIGISRHNRRDRVGRAANVPQTTIMPLRLKLGDAVLFAVWLGEIESRWAAASCLAPLAPTMLARLLHDHNPAAGSPLRVLLTGYGHGVTVPFALAQGMIDLGPLPCEMAPVREAWTTVDLSFGVGVVAGEHWLHLTRAADRIDDATASAVLTAVSALLVAVERQPSIPLDALEPAAPGEVPPPIGLDRWGVFAAATAGASINDEDSRAVPVLVPGRLHLAGRPTPLAGRLSAAGAIELLGPADPVHADRPPLALIERLARLIPHVDEARVEDEADLILRYRGSADPECVRSSLARVLPGRWVPRPERTATTGTERSPVPINALVAEIWAEILGRSGAREDADFFAAGGDSLMAVRMLARLRERLGVQLPLAEFLAEPRLDALSRFAARAQWLASDALVPAHEMEHGDL